MKVFAKIMAIAVLAAGFGGCTVLTGDEGYTFGFKVDNDTNLSSRPKIIKKIEFINGDRQNDDVLYWTTQTIVPGVRTTEQRIPGFTIEDELDSARRKCGVRITFEDETVAFNWYSFGHDSKVLVTVSYYSSRYIIGFSRGNW